jgi:hypothetical protein
MLVGVDLKNPDFAKMAESIDIFLVCASRILAALTEAAAGCSLTTGQLCSTCLHPFELSMSSEDRFSRGVWIGLFMLKAVLSGRDTD